MTHLLSDYDFDLPRELIAQYPKEKRDDSRLLVYNSQEKSMIHDQFFHLKNYLNKDDILVLNNTKVFSARITGYRETGGRFEILLMQPLPNNNWVCLVKPSGKMKKRMKFSVSKSLFFTIVESARNGYKVIQFNKTVTFDDLDSLGKIPLPPYIQRDFQEIDLQRYQTIFATKTGAVAAPTAGLHFTQALIDELICLGIQIIYVTLHVGPGTFRPVVCEDIRQHDMEKEFYHVSAQSMELLRRALSLKKKIIAVGTTSMRVLESLNFCDQAKRECSGWTELYIHPPYTFKRVSGMITNFHLPRSTLLVLVATFIGYSALKMIYQIAIEKKYRFYSYGDAMFLSNMIRNF